MAEKKLNGKVIAGDLCKSLNINNLNRGGRNRSLDIARAICIILVVIGHYSPEYSPDWWMDMRTMIYSFHMPLFMLVSGFVYQSYKKDNVGYWQFLWRKVKRLMIPYFVVSILIISIKLLTQGNAYVENPVTVWSYLKMFYHPEAGYFLWFIWALWWMFVIAPLFNNFILRGVFLVGAALIHYFVGIDSRMFALHETFSMMVYFAAGMVLVDVVKAKGELKQLINGKGAIVSAVVFLMAYMVSILVMPIDGLVIAFCGIWVILSVSRFIVQKCQKHNGWLYATASASYVVYLLHTTFEGFAKSAIRKIPAMTDGENTLMFLFGAMIVIGCGTVIPVLLHKYVLKKYRITKFAFGL